MSEPLQGHVMDRVQIGFDSQTIEIFLPESPFSMSWEQADQLARILYRLNDEVGEAIRC